MKPREFWITGIDDYDKIIFTEDDVKKFRSDFNSDGQFIHVREVRPEVDQAIEQMAQALQTLTKRVREYAELGLIEAMDAEGGSIRDAEDIAHSALEAWRKANE